MSKVRIITDSNAFLSPAVVEKFGITVVPHRIKVGGAFFEEDADFTAADLFAYRSGLGRCGRRAHALRRWAVRARAWVTPRSPMITAAEALTAPLFTRRQNCRVRFVCREREKERKRKIRAFFFLCLTF